MLSILHGHFVLNRINMLIIGSLIATWSIAYFIPTWSSLTQETLAAHLAKYREKIPSIQLDFHPNEQPQTAYNSSKLAMLIEPRPIPHLVPQLLHMMSVVPPDWRFLFIGTNESVTSVSKAYAIKYQQTTGKLDLMVAPEPWSIIDKEHIWRMLTDLRFYEELLSGVEWLLKFESDSILCSNSNDTLNNWLNYDWASSLRPQKARSSLVNGGLSLRRVSVVKKLLSFQTRHPGGDPEDEWFGKKLTSTAHLKIVTTEEQKLFAVEDVFYEKPMGYHLRKGAGNLPKGVWEDQDQRKKIFDYCPEIAIILDMKLEVERCKGDNGKGKIEIAVS